MTRRSMRLLVGMFAAAFLTGTAAQLYAFHQWGCYHWAWPTESGWVELGYRFGGVNTNRDYRGAFERTADVWNTAYPLYLFPVGSGNQLTWYARRYGSTGWLGVAQIYPSGCIITRATSRLNDTYLRSARYSQTNIDHVACQEVGHTFGLEHDRTRTDTCMNDRILAAGAQISDHDYEMLWEIYP